MAEEQRRYNEELMRVRSQRARPMSSRERREEERRRYEEARVMGYREGVELASRQNDYQGMYPDLFDDEDAVPRRGGRPARRDRYDDHFDDDIVADERPRGRGRGRRRR